MAYNPEDPIIHNKSISRTTLSLRNSRIGFRHRLTYGLIVLVLITSSQSPAEESDKDKLDALQLKIEKLQSQLAEDNRDRDHAVYLLQLAEKEVSTASAKLRKTEFSFQASQQELQKLQNQEQDLKTQLSTNTEFLSNQIRAAYGIGNQEYVKLLLNQQDPSSVSRMLVYYRYFNQSRLDKLQSINHRLSELKEIRRNIETETATLANLKQSAFREREELKQQRSERNKVVASLTASLQQKKYVLDSMLRDEQHLKKLLNEIETQLKDVQLDLAPPKQFRQLKGELDWPVKGAIAAYFGTTRKNSGDIKWKGLVINTDYGAAITSVAYGRVVFADWLRGFGMLIIIDHGDGYMSLYGHNEQLHKKLGDWVQANETIATSGHTGGQMTTSLYFEIRHNGTPQDPVKWCKSLPQKS